jgi:hypothetical protein
MIYIIYNFLVYELVEQYIFDSYVHDMESSITQFLIKSAFLILNIPVGKSKYTFLKSALFIQEFNCLISSNLNSFYRAYFFDTDV